MWSWLPVAVPKWGYHHHHNHHHHHDHFYEHLLSGNVVFINHSREGENEEREPGCQVEEKKPEVEI